MTEEIENEKKIFRKFQSEISSIFWNPQKSFFDPKIHIFDPRTPKFGILVQNGAFIHTFLEFLKNVENWPFYNFDHIWYFRFLARQGPRKSDNAQISLKNFLFLCFFWICKNIKNSNAVTITKTCRDISIITSNAPLLLSCAGVWIIQ